jgi:putative membrane protein
MLGSAQSTELKSPRSHTAWIERHEVQVRRHRPLSIPRARRRGSQPRSDVQAVAVLLPTCQIVGPGVVRTSLPRRAVTGEQPAGGYPRPMTRAIAAWLSNCAALLAAAAIVPAIGYGEDVGTLLLAGAILGLVNLLIRPFVILLALPAVLLSLGIALVFVNALMLYITSLIVPQLTVGGFWSTVAGALVVSAANLLLRRLSRWWETERPALARRNSGSWR